jgi:hypothetical protein
LNCIGGGVAHATSNNGNAGRMNFENANLTMSVTKFRGHQDHRKPPGLK